MSLLRFLSSALNCQKCTDWQNTSLLTAIADVGPRYRWLAYLAQALTIKRAIAGVPIRLPEAIGSQASGVRRISAESPPVLLHAISSGRSRYNWHRWLLHRPLWTADTFHLAEGEVLLKAPFLYTSPGAVVSISSPSQSNPSACQHTQEMSPNHDIELSGALSEIKCASSSSRDEDKSAPTSPITCLERPITGMALRQMLEQKEGQYVLELGEAQRQFGDEWANALKTDENGIVLWPQPLGPEDPQSWSERKKSLILFSEIRKSPFGRTNRR